MKTEQHNEDAFVNGWREIASRSRWEAAETIKEISKALKQGGLCKKALHLRKYGYVKHTPAERKAIEVIFRKHSVKAPWGL